MSGQPWTQGVMEDVVRGVAVGGTLGLAAPLMSGGATATISQGTVFQGGREVLRGALNRGMASITSAQAANIGAQAFGKGRVDEISIIRAAGGNVTATFTRAGRDGYQVLTKVINAAGETTSMIQRAYNSAGEQTHYHVWK